MLGTDVKHLLKTRHFVFTTITNTIQSHVFVELQFILLGSSHTTGLISYVKYFQIKYLCNTEKLLSAACLSLPPTSIQNLEVWQLLSIHSCIAMYSSYDIIEKDPNVIFGVCSGFNFELLK